MSVTTRRDRPDTIRDAVRVVTTVGELRAAIHAAREDNRSIGLTPTMGALHEGHLSLVRAARAACTFTVATIFVNPTQFGPHEDFARYPRTLDADLAALAGCGTDLIFVPDADELYPADWSTSVEPPRVARRWEGECRPGHFRGVATVVLKLFNLVQPAAAFFGCKDYQQAVVIRRMVRDLDVPVEIHVCPTVREPDGLAMSSRNRYLSPDERHRATAISRGLRQAEALALAGERRAEALAGAVRNTLAAAGVEHVDYIAVVDPETLEPIAGSASRAVILIAARVGGTRLIDNMQLVWPDS